MLPSPIPDNVICWRWSQLQDLNANELFDILKARQQVFIVEQRCAYQDADDLDPTAWHLTGHAADTRLVVYLRVNPPGSRYTEPSIGRLLTVRSMRGRRLASLALQKALVKCEKAYPGHAIRVAAQTYLEAFYRRFGFRAGGAPYEEDGIAHLDMIRPAGAFKDPD